jgi:hypothetical protein
MKKFLLSIVALMATFTASAQFSADPANLTIAAGEEKEVIFSLTTEVEVCAYEMWLQCPEGIELATRMNEDDETEYCIDFEGNRHKSTHAIVSGFNKDKGMYLISVTSNKNANLRELEGAVLKVKFKATADVDGAIKIQDSFAGTAAGVKYPFENKDFITINGTAINSISAEQTKSGVIYNIAGQRVSKATKGIFIVDGKKVAVK